MTIKNLAPEVQAILTEHVAEPAIVSKPKQPIDICGTFPTTRLVITALAIIIVLGAILWLASITQALGNQETMNEKTNNAIIIRSNLTNNRISNLEQDTRDTTASLGIRIGKLEKNPTNLSVIQNRLDSLNISLNSHFQGMEQNLTRLEGELALANRQIAVLLAAQNGSGSSQSVQGANGTGNLTTLPLPDFALRYQNLTLDANGKTCRDRLVDIFCVNDYCRRTLDPEWLCSASQQMPEYALWNEQACACAREAGLPY